MGGAGVGIPLAAGTYPGETAPTFHFTGKINPFMNLKNTRDTVGVGKQENMKNQKHKFKKFQNVTRLFLNNKFFFNYYHFFHKPVSNTNCSG